jgi:Ribosomal protein L11 methyltransferase (PrmA)
MNAMTQYGLSRQTKLSAHIYYWGEQAMLAIGAAILGASHVLAVDCDEGALDTAAENCQEFDSLPVSTAAAHAPYSRTASYPIAMCPQQCHLLSPRVARR